MAKSRKTSVGRRGFLKNAAAGAAALVTTTPLVEAQVKTMRTGARPQRACRLRRRRNSTAKPEIFGRRRLCARSRGRARI